MNNYKLCLKFMTIIWDLIVTLDAIARETGSIKARMKSNEVSEQVRNLAMEFSKYNELIKEKRSEVNSSKAL